MKKKFKLSNGTIQDLIQTIKVSSFILNLKRTKFSV